MPLSLFEYKRKRHFKDHIGIQGQYAHSFGGLASEFGVSFLNASKPLHLIYRLDLSDPMVPFEVSDSGFLYLFYGFDYGDVCCYRLNSDQSVEIIIPSRSFRPPWNAPLAFPLTPTSLSEVEYNAKVAADGLRLKGVFGWDQLSREELNHALEIAKSLTDYSLADAPDNWSYTDLINCMFSAPFAQEKPGIECQNPTCIGKTKVIAIQDNPSPPEQVWPDAYVQTIWQACDLCACITVINQIGKSPMEL